MSLIDIILSKYKVDIGDYVKIRLCDGSIIKGLIMPKHIYSKEDILVIKLDNGYNIGIKVSRIEDIKKDVPPTYEGLHIEFERRYIQGLPRVLLLGVGGTILSRVDYRTGGVKSAVSAEEIIEILPEIQDIAEIHTRVIMNKYSEHLTPSDWSKIANEVYRGIREGYDGVIVLHGTDTLGYTAAALSFAIQKSPIPIILVGSQRSSDRPSSDAALNLISAVYIAGHAPFAGVYVVMHASSSDNKIAVHLGTRVRKNHTSRRDAFQSIDILPVAYVDENLNIKINYTDGIYKRDKNRSPDFHPKFSRNAALIKFYPGMHPEILKSILGLNIKALVIEGTGLGHLGEHLFEVLETLIREGVHVFVTSQCIWGRVNLNVYDTGRILLKIGLIPLGNMLSETAYVKASWILGNFGEDELPTLMPTNIAGEITSRSPVKDLRCI
ncbi:Glu-tRNA(Gln) amidotransferase GatDE subunit D [Candidatus Geothermarchaeota archaeon]|nr:MAG: Glu-tRNA(Gln) amidotransferase GatDE subunit D [Candidatus Geothermarchaeota archaeon]